ncbi:uncharacterized protein LOC133811171 [Humulus lupulus]|uniref:uncharacterized protein LOC133811166 n=1 Tax=Humulus lupulus TaxID=3486 RepID=UPI002B40993A|nr:uncharacterized protein LOC133811166 [Humulus lupulus]XP_062102131.1 uncharacterized protein LOC133811167 [Humulus lupulus]XP_062102132.1 uncharacterized protein LOC133811169 [Humulus lupulus]XP_062102133.1 uncharacterized protein LOC133811170 [Humulus lupulus]XP_062102134.1 uncharacterized protein LOC133811171 [Humulus lupulus]
MGLFPIDKSLLRAGDHVYGYRNTHVYTHHGIYVGDDRVIHFTSPDFSKSPNHVTSCGDCNYAPTKDRGVVKSCLDCFLNGHSLYLFDYGVSSSRFFFNRSGTCSTGSCIYSPDDVVRRAADILNSDEGFGDYDFSTSNCETFAVYCKTGKRVSLQIFSWKNKGKTAFEDMTRQPLSVKNTAKTVFNVLVKQKIDTLRYDIRMHQQESNGADEDQQEKKDDDDGDKIRSVPFLPLFNPLPCQMPYMLPLFLIILLVLPIYAKIVLIFLLVLSVYAKIIMSNIITILRKFFTAT